MSPHTEPASMFEKAGFKAVAPLQHQIQVRHVLVRRIV